MTRSGHAWLRGAAICVAAVSLGSLVWPGGMCVGEQPDAATAMFPAPVSQAGIPKLARLFEPVAGPTPASGETDSLVLIGIAGRLPVDAEVMVRTPWGKTSTLRIGDSLLGWKLVAVAPDRATFDRNGSPVVIIMQASP